MNQAVVVKAGNFPFEGIIIQKLMLHIVHPRSQDKTRVPPVVHKHFITLSPDEKAALQSRITAALGNKSHGLEMDVDQSGEGSFFQIAAEMLHCSDERFIDLSETLANRLTDALSRRSPSGTMAIVSGLVGEHAKPFVCVVKAEFQDGFTTSNIDDDTVALSYIEDIFLTEAQRLYKVGCLVEEASQPPVDGLYDKNNYRAFLFDHLITNVETRTAAEYFYGSFLGMSVSASSKKLTQNFYDFTLDYVNSLDIDEESKREHVESLRSELKSQTAIISVDDFSRKYFSEDLAENYRDYMEDRGFPDVAVDKDLDYIKSKLKKSRRMGFSTGVKILGPSDNFNELVTLVEKDEESSLVRIQGAVSEIE